MVQDGASAGAGAMYASFVSRPDEASESDEEVDDPSQDDDDVVRYERTSHHQSRRDELIKRVQAAHAHSAAIAAGEDGAGADSRPTAAHRSSHDAASPQRTDEQRDEAPAAAAVAAPAAAAAPAPADGGARQDTLDVYLPDHAARARELEAASAYSFDGAAPSASTGAPPGGGGSSSSGGGGSSTSTSTSSRSRGGSGSSSSAMAESEGRHGESAGSAVPAARGAGRAKRKRLESHSLHSLGGGRHASGGGGGLDLIGAFRANGAMPNEQAHERRRAPTGPGRSTSTSSRPMRSHSLRPTQQPARRAAPVARRRADSGGGLDLVGAFRSSASQSSQSSQSELPSQQSHTKKQAAPVAKATPAKTHTLRRGDPTSGERNGTWKAPPSFLGGPARSLSTQSTASTAFENLQHPAEATQSRLGDKKGLKGERERVISEMKSGAFASERPAVKLRFRMLDGSTLRPCHTPQALSAYEPACFADSLMAAS